QGVVKRSLQKTIMMEQWTSYHTRALHSEEKLAKEQERIAKHLAQLEEYKASLAEKLTAAEKAEARVKGHLRTAREEKTKLTAQLESARGEVVALKEAVSHAQDEAEASQRLVAKWSKKADDERKNHLNLVTQNAELLEAQKTWEKQRSEHVDERKKALDVLARLT
ncbi:unnamed protein product, partial [Urochloa humidicola]